MLSVTPSPEILVWLAVGDGAAKSKSSTQKQSPWHTALFLISLSLSFSLTSPLPYRPRGLPTLLMLSKSVQSSSIIRAAHWDSAPSASSAAPSYSPSHSLFFSPRPPKKKKKNFRDSACLWGGERERQTAYVCVQYLNTKSLKRRIHFEGVQ